MKKLYLILIILISFDFSNQFNTLPNKLVPVVKCFFGSAENIKTLTEFVDAAFGNIANMFVVAPKLGALFQECLGVALKDILPFLPFLNAVQNQKEVILNKLKKANAPLLLKRYLYDATVKNDVFKAKRECVEMTQMIPYDQYKKICDLFE